MLHIYKDLINQMLKKKVIYNIFLDFLPKFNLLSLLNELFRFESLKYLIYGPIYWNTLYYSVYKYFSVLMALLENPKTPLQPAFHV